MFSVNNKFNIFIFIAFSICTDIGFADVTKDLESIDINNAGDRVDKDMMEMEGRAGPFDLIQGIVDLLNGILSSNPLLTAETTTMSSVDIVDSYESTTSKNEKSTESSTSNNEESTESSTSNNEESTESSTSSNKGPSGPINGDNKEDNEKTDKGTGEEQKENDRESCPSS